MFQHITHINRKILAYFFVLLFAFANTPKRILHDVVTSHKHSTHQEKSCTHKHTEVTTSGYHCDTENLVVNGIYTIVFEPTFIFAKPDFFIAFSASAYYTQTLHQQYFLLRGPPVC
ncbi:MAG: hypothetical protein NTZ59_02980 [Bacteroidetes bacterium]|nr:hypothetical protein [Bacteroidota bacterium]